MKTKIIIAAALLAGAMATAAGQQPQPQKMPAEYHLTVSPEQVDQIGRAIMELPARIANPLTQSLVEQIKTQTEAFNKKAEPEAPKTEKKP